jgi:serine/threonine protein kinase
MIVISKLIEIVPVATRLFLLQPTITRKLEYQDGLSAVALWWKSIFLAPFWGTLVIPVLGAMALVFVNDKSLDFFKSPGWQICLAFTMGASILYFFDDLRKRTIYFSNDVIVFGLRRYALSSLISIGVEYKDEQLMPKRVLFRFRDGKLLRLRVSRLRNQQFESVLHFVETRLPQVQIDPVLLTLMRCRRAAGKAISDSGESVEIRYESRFVLKELIAVFTKTWDEWSAFGPVFVGLLSVPLWTMWITSLFMWPIIFLQVYTSPDKVNLSQMLLTAWTGAAEGISRACGGEKMKAVADLAGSPPMVLLLCLVSIALLWALLRTVMRPNRIIVQADSVTLLLRISSVVLHTRNIPISSIVEIKLFKPNDMADPASWKIRFVLSDHSHIDLSIAAFSTEEKTRLTRSIQRLAPQIPIDAALLETLIPRQDRSYTELWLQSLSEVPERKSMDPLQPGQMIGNLRYQVIRCLGVGGQGTAYLAKDTGLVESRLSDLIVLKESIFPVYADSPIRMQALERFEKEASLLSRLEHPGIVSLRDFFLEDHRGYLVMEHVEGRTLKDLVQEEGALGEIQVRELALQMCDILTYLHASGVVHRDFTPDNLILGKSGQLKLIDFNVAHQMEAGSTGTIVGKQSYLPPEQFRGKATTQSDLYALGATLHFLLTGDEPEPICQSSPLQKGASCSQSLDAVVRDCTALQLSKRIGSAEDLKQRLLSRSELATDGQTIATPSRQTNGTDGTDGTDETDGTDGMCETNETATRLDLSKEELVEVENG